MFENDFSLPISRPFWGTLVSMAETYSGMLIFLTDFNNSTFSPINTQIFNLLIVLFMSSPFLIIVGLGIFVNPRPPLLILAHSGDPLNELYYGKEELVKIKDYLYKMEKLNKLIFLCFEDFKMSDFAKIKRYTNTDIFFHFIGHSDSRTINLSGEIISISEFVETVGYRISPKMIFINSCDSYFLGQYFSKVNTTSICTNGLISDKEAFYFSLRFYDELFKGRRVKSAYRKANINNRGPNYIEEEVRHLNLHFSIENELETMRKNQYSLLHSPKNEIRFTNWVIANDLMNISGLYSSFALLTWIIAIHVLNHLV